MWGTPRPGAGQRRPGEETGQWNRMTPAIAGALNAPEKS